MSQDQEQQQQKQQQSLPESIPPIAASYHYHDAFGDDDVGIDYGAPLDLEECEYDSVDGDAHGNHNESFNDAGVDDDANDLVSLNAATKSTDPKVSTQMQIDSMTSSTPLDELHEEVGLHETTLSTLHSKLTSLVSQIEAEETLAASLREEIQLLTQKKLILKKKTEGTMELVKRVEGTMEKTLGRLRVALGREQIGVGDDIAMAVDKAVNEGVKEQLQERQDDAPELMEDQVDFLSFEPTLPRNEQEVSKPDNKQEQDKSVTEGTADAYIEIPLHHNTEQKIDWPSEDSGITSKIEHILPTWRTNLPSPSLWNNLESPNLLTQLMNISALENLLQRQHYIDEGLLPSGDTGWVNENCIQGTPLDIYRHVDCKRWHINNYASLPSTDSDEAQMNSQSTFDDEGSALDPNLILCPYELGGTCADDRCPYQHLSRRPLKRVVAMEDGRRYLRYYALPDLRLPPALCEQDFIACEQTTNVDAHITRKDHGNTKNELIESEHPKNMYPCPMRVNVSLNASDLRSHMKQCKQNSIELNRNVYSVQNTLVADSTTAATNEKYAVADSQSKEQGAVGEISDFVENRDLVNLPNVAEESDPQDSDESVGDNEEPLRKGLLLEGQLWWQDMIPLHNTEYTTPNHNTIDLILHSFGFQPIRDESEYAQITLIRCLNPGQQKLSSECREILFTARIIDLCRICVQMGQISLAISLLQGTHHLQLNDSLVRYVLVSLKNLPPNCGAYDMFGFQSSLLLISEFCRTRYNWLSGNNSRPHEEPKFNMVISFLNDPMAATIDHVVRCNLKSRIPMEAKQSNWDHFVSCLQAQLDKHIVVPFSYRMTHVEQLSFLIECASIGQVLGGLVESIKDETFSPLAHVMDPTWLVMQRLLQNSTAQSQLEGNSGNAYITQVALIFIIGPVIFSCTSNIISRHLIKISPSSATKTKNLLPDTDLSRSCLDLSSIDIFIVEMVKDIKRHGRKTIKCTNIECLLSSLYAISASICIYLKAFDKAQLRLENAINSKKVSSHREALSINVISELLWSQLVHLRMICPSYHHSVDPKAVENTTSLPDSVSEIHDEIASRIFNNCIIIGGLDACGDRSIVSSAVGNHHERQQWQNLVSLAFQQYHSYESTSVKPFEEFDISYPKVKLNGLGVAEFPMSLLIAGKALKHLHLVGLGIDRLPSSFGMHLSSLLVSETLIRSFNH
eukprot:scaffold78549_cov98-Cyclotella_meneghiniana.AAC.1